MREVGAGPINAFRSGSFACNDDTFSAVAANGLAFDSSINPTLDVSQPGKVRDARAGCCEPFTFEGLSLYPMSVFRDGFGRTRHAQIGACSSRELCEAMQDAERGGREAFVLLSHNVELMIPARSDPDSIVAERFERVCRFLAENRAAMPTAGFHDLSPPAAPRGLSPPRAGLVATTIRHAEQALRRLHV